MFSFRRGRRRAVTHQLRKIAGRENTRTEPSELLAYSYDATFQQRLPTAAVAVQNTEQVASIVELAANEHIPVVARGAATGLAGGSVPPPDAIVLNLAKMRGIKDIDPDDGVAVVEPGVITSQFHAAVERVGLFYPPDPASLRQCTIGGNLACNAGGPRCLKYGVTRDYVRGVTVVLADGSVVETGGRVLKSSTGYALPHLFVGSEGTLGIITEAVLRLIPLPRGRATALVFFGSVEAATETVTASFLKGLAPATLEFLDTHTLELVSSELPTQLPEGTQAALLIETDSFEATEALDALQRVVAIARQTDVLGIHLATDEEESSRIWHARQAISGAFGRIAKGKLGEDVVVPRSKIANMVRAVEEISQTHGLPIPLFGHAGDGNLHPNILFDPSSPSDLLAVERAAIEIFERAIALGGALSGEHGIGTLKRQFLELNLGAPAVDTMRKVKSALDPAGIMNPGKIFPDGDADWSGFLRALPRLATP